MLHLVGSHDDKSADTDRVELACNLSKLALDTSYTIVNNEASGANCVYTEADNALAECAY